MAYCPISSARTRRGLRFRELESVGVDYREIIERCGHLLVAFAQLALSEPYRLQMNSLGFGVVSSHPEITRDAVDHISRILNAKPKLVGKGSDGDAVSKQTMH
jgi:hypothetical protein